MLINQGRIPGQHRQLALEKARDAYNVLYEEQGAQLENMPVHHQGEVLAGVAEPARQSRTGGGFHETNRRDDSWNSLRQTCRDVAVGPGFSHAEIEARVPVVPRPGSTLEFRRALTRASLMRSKSGLLAAVSFADTDGRPPVSRPTFSTKSKHHFAENADVRIHYKANYPREPYLEDTSPPSRYRPRCS